MDKKELDMLEKINSGTEDIKVPESLVPENIEKLLSGQEQKKRRFPYAMGAAAIFALVLLSAFVIYELPAVQEKVTKGSNGNASSSAKVERKIANAKSYEEVYKNIKKGMKDQYGGMSTGTMKDTKAKFAVPESSTAQNSQSMAKDDSAQEGFSQTNVRQEGVAEGDTIKTDGTYLYTLNENAREIGIVKTEGDRLTKIQNISLENGAQIAEFYIEDQQLIILYNVSGEAKDGIYPGENTKVSVYDLSDIKNPVEQGSITQSGRFNTSRIAGGYLYIFSDFSVYQEFAKDDIAMYVPEVNGKSVAESNIFMPAQGGSTQYSVVSAVKLDNPSQTTDSKAILSKGGMCYVSSGNIYMCDALYENSGNRTIIRKIGYKDGTLTPEVQGEIAGTLNDSFSIDEYEGKLRIVATLDARQIAALLRETGEGQRAPADEQQTGNALYVLDEKLNTIGKIADIAPGEEIKSARFMGETGYFVTFKNIDPLFSVDLSSPEAPKIIGALKIPGFSEYLHPYGDGRLLGIGLEMDESGMTMKGVKLSMFDTSDPTDVKEETKEVLKDTYNSSAMQDYRAVMIDTERNLIGFAADGNTEKYYLYSYTEEEGFKCLLEADMGMGSYMYSKGAYIGNRLYIVKGNVIQLYSMDDYKKLDDLVL